MNNSNKIAVVNEGNLWYHISTGCIEHNYFIDKNNEFATCACGRVLHKKKQLTKFTNIIK